MLATVMPMYQLLLAVPLASALIIALFLRRHGGLAATISVAAATYIAVHALVLALGADTRHGINEEWVKLGDFTVSIGVKYDDLAALMLVIVGIVGLCVHVFSLG